MYLAYCDKTDISGRMWETKYANAVFQTNIVSNYNQLCFAHKSVQIIFKWKSCYTKVMFWQNETGPLTYVLYMVLTASLWFANI